ncbi:hypothetical protein CsatA_014116 [Cannabis sativa]
MKLKQSKLLPELFLFKNGSCYCSPSFLQDYSSTNSFEQQQIPKTFWVKYCGSSSTQVFLKLPCGSTWEVGLTISSDEKVWIEKGWDKFSQHCSLSCGDLLVFGYEGNSQFNVMVFDKSTVEKDYPFTPPNHSEDKYVDIDSSNENSDLSWFSKTRDNPPLPSSVPHKKRKTTPYPYGKSEESSIPMRVEPQNIIRKQMYLTGQKKAEALMRAKGFKSDDPFFIVLMQPSFVGASYSMVVPFSFAKNHLPSVSKHEDVILKVQDERIWPVRYYYRKYAGHSQFRFEWGWKAFARDNDLKVGDVCVFVKRQNIGIMLFEVVTFYKNGVPNSPVLPAANNTTPCVKVEPSFTSNNYDKASMISHDIIPKKEVIEPSYKVCGESPEPENFTRNQELSEKEKAEAFKRVKDFKSEDPFFTVPMQPSFVGSKFKYCMGMPSLFAKKYLVGISNSPQDVILKVQDGRTWCVKYYVRPLGTSSKATIEGGWKAFVQDNELKVGDVCAFILRNSIGIISFEVVIFHGNGVATSCMLPIPGFGIVSEAASKFCSNNPYFEVKLRSSQLRGRPTLYIPMAIANPWFEKKAQIVTLWVGEEYWHVNLTVNKGSSSSGLEHRFSGGWRAFARDNSLQPNDVCIFELINKNKPEVKVTIFRQNGMAQE